MRKFEDEVKGHGRFGAWRELEVIDGKEGMERGEK